MTSIRISRRAAAQLGSLAGALVLGIGAIFIITNNSGPRLPPFFEQTAKSAPHSRQALAALWSVAQTHGDLQQVSTDPPALLRWAINDAEHGSMYSPRELGPYAADLIALESKVALPMPDVFVQISQGDTRAHAALQALWKTYQVHGDLQSFSKDPRGLLRWAIADAKNGSGYSPRELGPYASELIALEPKAAEPLPDVFVQISQGDAQARAAVEALWAACQAHGDLKKAFSSDPKGLLRWAIDDAKHGSKYSPKELGPHAAALIALESKAS